MALEDHIGQHTEVTAREMIWERLETRSQKLEKRIPEEGRIFTEKCPVFENQEKKVYFFDLRNAPKY